MILKSLRRLWRRLTRSRRVAKQQRIDRDLMKGRNPHKFKIRQEHKRRVAEQTAAERTYSFGGQRTLRPWKLADAKKRGELHFRAIEVLKARRRLMEARA